MGKLMDGMIVNNKSRRDKFVIIRLVVSRWGLKMHEFVSFRDLSSFIATQGGEKEKIKCGGNAWHRENSELSFRAGPFHQSVSFN